MIKGFLSFLRRRRLKTRQNVGSRAAAGGELFGLFPFRRTRFRFFEKPKGSAESEQKPHNIQQEDGK